MCPFPYPLDKGFLKKSVSTSLLLTFPYNYNPSFSNLSHNKVIHTQVVQDEWFQSLAFWGPYMGYPCCLRDITGLQLIYPLVAQSGTLGKSSQLAMISPLSHSLKYHLMLPVVICPNFCDHLSFLDLIGPSSLRFDMS